MQRLWEKSAQHEDLATITTAVFSAIHGNQGPFCLWLFGELGTGKTTLVRELLHASGLPETEQVVSPTYSYVQDYLIGEERFVHADLYRAGETQFSLDDYLGQKVRGFFIEWPPESLEASFPATHRLTIRYDEDSLDRRHYILEGSSL